jgi:hypothetical protein
MDSHCQFLIYIWQHWDDLNVEWSTTFSLGRSGPARRGQQGYHHINTAIQQMQQIVNNPSSHWVQLFLMLGIPYGSQLRPAELCRLPQSMCFLHCIYTVFVILLLRATRTA